MTVASAVGVQSLLGKHPRDRLRTCDAETPWLHETVTVSEAGSSLSDASCARRHLHPEQESLTQVVAARSEVVSFSHPDSLEHNAAASVELLVVKMSECENLSRDHIETGFGELQGSLMDCEFKQGP